MKSQISLFLIIGIILLASVAVIYTANRNNSVNDLRDTSDISLELASSQVKNIVEQCMAIAVEKGIFDKLALHGGYIETDVNESYGIYESVEYFPFLREKVPYWYKNRTRRIPSVYDMEISLGRYILAETEKCLNLSEFEKSGVKVSKPDYDYVRNKFNFGSSGISIRASMNYEDVTIDLHYPIALEYDSEIFTVDEYQVKLPINFLRDYETGLLVLEDALKEQPEWFDIGYNCTKYVNNGLTNIYYKNNRVIQVFDYETFYSKYKKTLRFQFSVEGINAIGFCPVYE